MTAFQFDPEIVPDADRVIERHRAWWNNECLDRPLVFLDCNLEKPTRPLLPIRDYSKDFLARQTDAEYRIAAVENRLRTKRWFGDAIPSVGAGMNISYTALLAGATIHYDGMDWIQASVSDWESAPVPRFDPTQPLLAKMIAACQALADNARGRYLIQTPAYVDCVTTMSQMRGTQEFCLDLVDCPAAVATYRDRYLAAWLESAAFWREFFQRNRYPGTTNWASAFSPDEYDQIQCDFCLMVSPDTFSWLIAPEQRAEAAFFDGAVYHLDGPGAVTHLDALLEIPQLKAIQWVPGAGQPTAGGWIPLLQRIQAAGKALQIYAKAAEVPIYKEHLRPEGLMLHFGFDEWGLSESQCEDLMRSIEAWPGRGTAVTVPAGAAESVTDDGIILLRLTAAEGGPGPTCLDVHLVHRGNHFARGFAERFNRAAHDVDASGLMIEGDQLGGLLRIVLQPDQWHPKAPVSCEFEIAASAVAPGQWQGVYKGTVGDSTVAGEVRAEDEPSASAADYRNATARLYLHDGFLTDDWDRDAAAELDVRDEAIVKAVAFREGAAEMDVGSLRLTPESLTGECRVTHRGQAPCAMRFAGTVVGRWIGGVLELAAEGQAPARRTFRGYVVFTKDSSVPAARGPASPVSDPTPLWSTERTIRREILKAKARALTDAFEARSFTPPNGAVMVYRLFRPSAHGNAGKRPLVLFLHGADARGADNARNYTHHGMLLGARIWALPEYQARHPCLVVVPQTMDHWAGASLDAALALVDALCGEFDVDRDRIYVTGLSLGGFGTFNALAARPRMFAAAVPVCGGGKPETAASFAHVPMWVFHGARDELVKPEESRRMVEALRRAGGSPAYTEYEGVGHNSFMEAYSEPALVDWVMNQGLLSVHRYGDRSSSA